MSPNQAANCPPERKSEVSGSAAAIADAVVGPMPGEGRKPAAGIIGAVPGEDLCFQPFPPRLPVTTA